MRLFVSLIVFLLCIVFNIGTILWSDWIFFTSSTEEQQQQPKWAVPFKATLAVEKEELQSTQSTQTTTPKIVLLAGPHKTGTTSVQHCMVDWTTTTTTTTSNTTLQPQLILLANWKWAIPNPEKLIQYNIRPLDHVKRFGPLLALLRKSDKFILNHTYATDRDAAIDIYRQELKHVWEGDQNIILGAEAIDHIVEDEYNNNNNKMKNGTVILDGLLNILPWNVTNNSTRPLLEKKDIEVVITYRSPRIDHLISLWYQLGKKGESISSFYLSADGANSIFKTNALGLALRFLEYGNIHTTILDMNGIIRSGNSSSNGKFGMCHVIACDVLGVQCNQDYQIIHSDIHESTTLSLSTTNTTATTTNISNYHFNTAAERKKRKGIMDLSNKQQILINQVMNIYDCSLRDRLEKFQQSKQLRILFPTNQVLLLSQHCSNITTTTDSTNITFTWMVQQIQEIIRQGRE